MARRLLRRVTVPPVDDTSAVGDEDSLGFQVTQSPNVAALPSEAAALIRHRIVETSCSGSSGQSSRRLRSPSVQKNLSSQNSGIIQGSPASVDSRQNGHINEQKNDSLQGSQGANSPQDSVSSISSRSTTNRKRLRGQDNLDDSQLDGSMYSILRQKSSGLVAVESMINSWIQKYEDVDKNEAMQELLQLFISATGSKEIIPANKSHRKILQQCEETYPSNAKSVLMLGIREKSIFLTNYNAFIIRLIEKCQTKIIYDTILMDNIISFVTGLSKSDLKPFRYVGTIAALKLITTLQNIMVVLSERLSEIEKYKTDPKYLTFDLKKKTVMEEKYNEIQKNLEEIENMLDHMDNEIFSKRLFDKNSELRTYCIQELTSWICLSYKNKIVFPLFKTNFLNIIKQIITLQSRDNSSSVRLASTKCLIKSWNIETVRDICLQKIDIFTARVMDNNEDVSIQTIKLIMLILQEDIDLLRKRDWKIIFELMYCCNRKLAQTAGEFFYNYCKLKIKTNIEELSARVTDFALSGAMVLEIVRYRIESSKTYPHAEEYLVDSLLESSPELENWTVITDLILKDNINEHQEILIKILICCIKQYTTLYIPQQRTLVKTEILKQDNPEMAIKKKNVTQYFIEKLPNLISIYCNQVDKLRLLLSMVQYFDSSVLKNACNQESLSSLINKLTEITLLTSDFKTLQSIFQSLEFLCVNELVNTVFTTDLIPTIGYGMLTTIENFYNIDFSEHQERENLSQWLENSVPFVERFAVLYEYSNVPHDLFLQAFEIAKKILTTFEEQAISFLSICYLYIIWKFKDFNNQKKIKEKSAMQDLELRHSELLHFCSQLVLNYDFRSSCVKEQIHYFIFDLLSMYTYMHQKMPPSLITAKDLEALKEELFSFTLEIVFPDDDQTHSSMKRKNFISGYCKLMHLKICSSHDITVFLTNYAKYHLEYKDYIKEVLQAIDSEDNYEAASIVHNALTIIYKNANTSAKLREIKKWIRVFSDLFEKDGKSCNTVSIFHELGIDFSIEDKNHYDYLTLLKAFSSKLDSHGKEHILDYLKEKYEGKSYKSLQLYQDTLKTKK